MRTWGASGAAAAIRRAQAVSAHARRTGCGVAEADEATLALARSFGFTLDNCGKYPPGTNPSRETMRFHGHEWPQAALNRDWHEWAWELFHHAASTVAPWPQMYNHNNQGGLRFDHMSVTSGSAATSHRSRRFGGLEQFSWQIITSCPAGYDMA